MSGSMLQPTPHPEINAALHQVLTHMQTTLGDQLVGLYLGGSLALGAGPFISFFAVIGLAHSCVNQSYE